MNKRSITFGISIFLLVVGCSKPSTPEAGPPVSSAAVDGGVDAGDPGIVNVPDAGIVTSTVSIKNDTGKHTVVYLAFGADSVVLPSSAGWSFCKGSGLNCTFPLNPDGLRELPLAGQYLNVTISFGQAVTCGVTKAELNVNNPKWYDVMDVSLVDGFSNEVEIETKDSNGPHVFRPNGPNGNATALGVFPIGCDVCVQRQKPPCGMSPGPVNRDGCKAGTQFNPNPPCQYQGPTMSGGSTVLVRQDFSPRSRLTDAAQRCTSWPRRIVGKASARRRCADSPRSPTSTGSASSSRQRRLTAPWGRPADHVSSGSIDASVSTRTRGDEKTSRRWRA